MSPRNLCATAFSMETNAKREHTHGGEGDKKAEKGFRYTSSTVG